MSYWADEFGRQNFISNDELEMIKRNIKLMSCKKPGVVNIELTKIPEAKSMDQEPEFTGGNVNYYVVPVPDPKRLDAYTAECEDIIQALGMTFAEGCAFKAIWRSAAARTLGLKKTGQDAHGVYDAEKVIYYGNEMLRERKRAQAKSNKGE